MAWSDEFDVSYAPPAEVLAIEGIDDLSWHNDVSPSFGKFWDHGELDLRIWCGHPDPDHRDHEPRYLVLAYAWTVDGQQIIADADLPRVNPASPGDDGCVSTDNVTEAISVFFAALARLHAAIRRQAA